MDGEEGLVELEGEAGLMERGEGEVGLLVRREGWGNASLALLFALVREGADTDAAAGDVGVEELGGLANIDSRGNLEDVVLWLLCTNQKIYIYLDCFIWGLLYLCIFRNVVDTV